MSITYYNIDLDKVVPKLKQILMKDNRIKIAIIFGSALRRKEVRDIDVAIYAYPQLILKEILLLGDKLERAIGVPVDLIPLDETPPKLQYKILMYGSPIIVRDKNLYNRLISFAFGQLQDIQLKLTNL